MFNKKAFTLVELLAVITVIGIVALIATPIILNVINNSKEQSLKESAKSYVKSLEATLLSININDKFKPTFCEFISNTLICDGEELIVDSKGVKPTGGKIYLEDNEVIKVLNLKIEDKYITIIEDEIQITEQPY